MARRQQLQTQLLQKIILPCYQTRLAKLRRAIADARQEAMELMEDRDAMVPHTMPLT